VSVSEDAVSAWESLFRAQVSLLRRFAADDVWDVVSMREYDVLFNLSRGSSLRLRDLHEAVLLSQPSLSRLVERLAVAGLVSRAPDPEDGRGTLVSLTPAGAEVQRRIGRRHAASIRRCLGEALSPAEMRQLQALCDKLR
jgi:DNA-binding MarR family transcriptional regulator